MRFTAKKIQPIGDKDDKYGQRYWGYTEDSEMPISFNLMNPVDIPEGAALEFEERTIKETGPQSKNPGSEYLFLKKVKVIGGESLAKLPASGPQKLLELIYSDTQEILKLVKKDAPAASTSLKEQWDKTTGKDDVVADLGDDEEIDLSAIPF